MVPRTLVFKCLHRIVLVVHRRGRAGEIVDQVHFQEDRVYDVMTDQFKAGIFQKMRDVLFAAGGKSYRGKSHRCRSSVKLRRDDFPRNPAPPVTTILLLVI